MLEITDVARDYVWTYPLDFQPIVDGNRFAAGAQSWTRNRSMVIYIHVPFCWCNCPWCVFYHERFSEDRLALFMTGIQREIECYAAWSSLRAESENRTVSAIYIGGGTGCALPARDAGRVLHLLRSCFPVSNDAEITMECHPTGAAERYLADIRELGVNRVSFGIQSFQRDTLQSLRVIQTSEVNRRALEVAKSVGFPRISMDLIYRVPGQTLESLDDDLRAASDSEITGISCYSLEATETCFEHSEQPNARMDHDMFYHVGDFLESRGFQRSTQPDFCRPGAECKYVQSLWGAPQAWGLGFGPSALSSEACGYTFLNLSDLAEYSQVLSNGCLPILGAQELTRDEAMARYCVLGMRCLKIPRLPFRLSFGLDPLEAFPSVFDTLLANGLVAVGQDAISLTRDGLYFVDNVSKMFYTPRCSAKEVPWGKLDRGKTATAYPSAAALRVSGSSFAGNGRSRA